MKITRVFLSLITNLLYHVVLSLLLHPLFFLSRCSGSVEKLTSLTDTRWKFLLTYIQNFTPYACPAPRKWHFQLNFPTNKLPCIVSLYNCTFRGKKKSNLPYTSCEIKRDCGNFTCRWILLSLEYSVLTSTLPNIPSLIYKITPRRSKKLIAQTGP